MVEGESLSEWAAREERKPPVPRLPEDLAEIDGSIPPGTDVLDSAESAPAVIRGGALRALAHGIGVLLMLAAVPLLVRHLGTDDFGRYTVVISLIALMAGLSDGGLFAIGLREFAVLTPSKRDSMMRNLLGVRIALTLTGIAFAVCFASVAGYGSTLVLGTFIAGCGQLVLSVHNMYTVPLQATLRFGWVAAGELIRVAVQVLLIVVLVVAGATLIWFLGVTSLASVVAIIPIVWLARRMMPLGPAFHPAVWWPLLKDTIPYSAAIAVSATYFRITVILTSLIATETQTGYFSASYRVIEVLAAIPLLVIGAVFPILSRAAHNNRSRLSYVSSETFNVAVIFGAWIGLCVLIAAPFIIDVIAGADFEPSVAVLRIQAPAILATFVASACGFMLLSMHRHRALLIASLCALVASATLTIALVPPLHEQGAAIAATSAELALAVAMTWLVLRSGAVRLRFGLVPMVTLAAGVGTCTMLIPGMHSIARAAIASIVYFTILAVTGRIPSELIDVMKSLLRRRPQAT